MSDIKQYVWRKITLYEWELEGFLTEKNFQPGKFQILRSPNPLSRQVDIVYVVSETDPVKEHQKKQYVKMDRNK